jgi:GxxExxY protein
MLTEAYQEEALCHEIIGSAIEVHKQLGPGLLESVYEACLVCEFSTRNINFTQQCYQPIFYKNIRLAESFRIDFVVEDKVVVEIKAVEQLASIHECQLLSYLKLSGKKVGLLINFNVPVLKEGIRRRVL